MIELKNVRPVPLIEMPGGIRPDSGVFGRDCRFEKGRRYLIEAPSGRGKSTLLHIIYGLRPDYEGEVMVHGKDIRSFRPDDWAGSRQRELAIVFQDLRLFPKLTALENILLKAGQTALVPEDQIRQWAERLGIGSILDQTAATLSYGQRQRVAIIRALCQPFGCLLLDEPFSHLDGANTRLAFDLVREVCHERGAGFVLVSLGEPHNDEFDEILVL